MHFLPFDMLWLHFMQVSNIDMLRWRFMQYEVCVFEVCVFKVCVFHQFLDTPEKRKQGPRVTCFHQMCRTYIRLVISSSEFSRSAVCGLCFRGLCSRHPPSDTKQSNMLGNIKDLKTADTYLSVGNQVQFRIVIRTWWPQIEPERISGLNCSRTLDHLLCVLIWVASRYHLTFTTKYIHSVLKTFLPLVTRPCRFDQTTQGKIKPRTEGFINHVPMAAILKGTGVQKPVGSGDLS